jgi:hypothetical protein
MRTGDKGALADEIRGSNVKTAFAIIQLPSSGFGSNFQVRDLVSEHQATGPDGLPLDATRCPQTPFHGDHATMAECCSTLASGSYQGIVVVDDKDRYRGVIMPADLYSGLIDSPSNGASIISLARHSDTFLRPNMNVKAAMEHFDRAEAELLAVVSDDAHSKVVGDLTESYARRRYAEELDQAIQGIV